MIWNTGLGTHIPSDLLYARSKDGVGHRTRSGRGESKRGIKRHTAVQVSDRITDEEVQSVSWRRSGKDHLNGLTQSWTDVSDPLWMRSMCIKELPLARTEGDENAPTVGQLAHPHPDTHTHTHKDKLWTPRSAPRPGRQGGSLHGPCGTPGGCPRGSGRCSDRRPHRVGHSIAVCGRKLASSGHGHAGLQGAVGAWWHTQIGI